VLGFAGHTMPSFRPESHKTLVELLKKRRRAKRWSLKLVVARLPAWVNFDFSKLARIERGVRDVSYAELREIAIALKTTIGDLDDEVDAVLAAKSKAEHGAATSVKLRRKRKL
jgi:transcriptional regulator with XRE-family HTH domain